MSCIANHPLVPNSAARLPLAFGPAVGEEDFRKIQDRMSLDCCKWDSQISDTSTLFRQPLLIGPETWLQLKQMAEDLAAELMAAEQELLERPGLYALLGLPMQLRSALEQARRHGPTPAAARTLRFDFHYTADGWRISEVNSDVPGGYTEASSFTELMASCSPQTRPTGNPGNQWADAMMSVAGERSHVALLSAPGFLEDQQVTVFLAGKLQERGVEPFLLHHPAQLNWASGRASIFSKGKQIGIDAVVRFYQGEWLAKLAGGCGWKWFFAEGKTPVANPGTAVMTESKRFPVVWDELRNHKMTRWRALLPECRDPIEVPLQSGDEWVLKASLSNTGDAVHMRELMNREAWTKLCRLAERHARRWIVQRRFDPLPVASDTGAVYPCIGVYTIDGRAAGVYARAGITRIIDYAALEVALLIDEKRNAEQG